MSAHLLQIQWLSKAVPWKVLFDDLDFLIFPGDKIWLVWDNGAWKSTLLKIIAWTEDEDAWSITYDQTKTIWMLSQKQHFPNNTTVKEVLYCHESPIGTLLYTYAEAVANKDSDRLPWLVEEIQAVDGRSWQHKIETASNKLWLGPLLDKTIEQCSWGECKRLALAKLLIDEPDFLILDEPTNHLDVAMIDRLEQYLSSTHRTVLLVTHDRYFLERICDSIAELDRWKLYTYSGNYTEFCQQKVKRLELEAHTYHKTKQKYKDELWWMKKQASARSTKSNKRKENFENLSSDLRHKRNQLEDKRGSIDISLQQKRLWGNIISLHNIHKAFWEQAIVSWFSYNFSAWERIGIVWKNGVGKSTFIEILVWKQQPDQGTVKTWKTITTAVYKQEYIDFEPHKKVIDLIKDVAEYITVKNGKQISASQLLETFLFSKRQQQQRARTLSWWERRRIGLIQTFMKNPNFLILDEPTNDFDIRTITVLEEFLKRFKWCIVVVSHDRYFLDNTIDTLFIFEGEWHIRPFPWNYSARKDSLIDQDSLTWSANWGTCEWDSSDSAQSSWEKTGEYLDKQSKKKRWLSNNERKEYKQLGMQIEQRENERHALHVRMQQEDFSHTEIKELSQQLADLWARIEKAETRRFELAERK